MKSMHEVLMYISKKWYIVLACALIGASALYIEKAQVAPSVEVNGDLLLTRTIRIEPIPYATFGSTDAEINLINQLESWKTQQAAIKALDDEFDFEKLCKGWHNLKLSDKLRWVSMHMRVAHVGPGLYELEIQFSSTDAKDTKFIQENSIAIMNKLVDILAEVSAPITAGATWQNIDDYHQFDTNEVVTQSGLRKKYVIVGFVLGALAGSAALAVLSLRKRENV